MFISIEQIIIIMSNFLYLAVEYFNDMVYLLLYIRNNENVI